MSDLDEIDDSNTQRTMISGTVVEGDLVIMIEYADKIRRFQDEIDISMTSGYDAQRTGSHWGGVIHSFKLVSICVYRKPDGSRLYVALSPEGDVLLWGPGRKVEFNEEIIGAGLHKSHSRFFGYVDKIRQIGGHLYVCGGARQFYRRSDDGQWSLISGSILVDPDEQRRLPDPMDATRHFIDFGGISEEAIYACGLNSEIYFYDGSAWTEALNLQRGHLSAMHVTEDGTAYAGGMTRYGGLLCIGSINKGFREVDSPVLTGQITGIASFHGQVFIATSRGMLVFEPISGRLERYRTDLTPDLVDCHHLEARDGVLWSFGYKDLAWFDGRTWTRIHHPENPRIGD